MPEIKNNFTSGKMNKDLDERLLPKNEYRDALNIDIATTEGSDIGSAQNSYGNVKISTIGIAGAKCVGSILNPENQKIIWFISGTSQDVIAEYDQSTQQVEAILVDNHGGNPSFLNFTNEHLVTGINVIDGMLFWTDGNSEPKKINIDRFSKGTDASDPFTTTSKFVDASNVVTSNNVLEEDITVVKQYPLNAPSIDLFRDIAGTGDPSSCTVFTPENTTRTSWGDIFGAGSTDSVEYYNTVFKRTLDGNVTTTTIQFNNTDDGGNLSNSPYWNNVVVGMTMTDENGRSIKNPVDNTPIGVTVKDDSNHRLTVSAVPSFVISGVTVVHNDATIQHTANSNIVVGAYVIGTGIAAGTTVLSITNSTTFELSANASGNYSGGSLTITPLGNNSKVGFRWSLAPHRNESFWKYVDATGALKLKPEGTTSNSNLLDENGATVFDENNNVIRTQKLVFNPRPNFIENDVVVLSAPNTTSTSSSSAEVKIRIRLLSEDIWNDPVHSNQYRKVFNFKILSIDNEILAMPTADLKNWNATRETSTSIFEDKFPRFAYRWKYIDNEYSCISAFTEVAFLPTEEGYNFDSALGANTNIQNTVSKIVLKEFDTTPQDVVSLDVLIKFSDSQSIYKYKTIDSTDLESLVTFEITSDQIHAMLPSNQILRPYDNVPKAAKAQEITANRLLYANYTNQYNIDEEPRFELSVQSSKLEANQALKSVKSLRTYQLGASLLDKFGRQTPVYSQADTCTVTLSQEEAYTANNFFVTNDFVYPTWATHIKHYIKEPKGEFYNITMDRIYEAETEDFVWISFPSSDVNKVSEGDEIVLKKAHDTSQPILPIPKTIKYKVIAKKANAPDVIKSRRNLIGRLENQLFGTNGDASTGYPVEGGIVVRLRGTDGVGADSRLSSMADATSNDRYIRIGSYIKNTVSNFYEVESIVKEDVNDDGDFTDNVDYYEILLKKPFGSDINFTSPPPGSTTRTEYFELYEQELKEYDEEFQGRFFVKILKDDYLKENVTEVLGADGTNFGIVSTQPMSWIQNVYTDEGANQETGFGDNAAKTNVHGNMNASFLKTYSWPSHVIIKVNQTGGNSDEIIFDDITGVAVGNKIQREVTLYGGTIAYQDILNSSQVPITVQSLDDSTKTITFSDPFPFGNDDNFKIKYQERISDDLNIWAEDGDDPSIWVPGTMKNYWSYRGAIENKVYHNGQLVGPQRWAIDQAWSFFQGETPENSPISIFDLTKPTGFRAMGHGFVVGQTTCTFRIFNLGPRTGGYTFHSKTGPSRQHITENFTLFQKLQKPGTQFRWTEDPTSTVYTVERALFVDVNNHTNVNTDSYFSHRHNQGVKFHLELDKPIAWSPCQRYYDETTQTNSGSVVNPGKIKPYYGTQNSAVATNKSELQILNPVTEGQTFNSDSPAVFEVLPKEISDLNLYYETPKTSLILKDDMYIERNVLKPNGSIDVNVFVADAQIVIVDSALMEPAFYIKGNSPYNEQVKHVEEGSYVTIYTKDLNGNTKFKQKLLIKNGVAAPGTVTRTINQDNSYSGTARNNFYYKVPLNWYNCYAYGNGVESNRIQDAFNEPTIDKGPRVSTTFMGQYEEETKPNGIIFSGIYNGASSINNLNQFIMAEGITKDLNPSYGSIQKLFTRNTNVISFCENKTLKILANKDALFNADGKTNVTATNKVLGQTVPFAGEFGISKNPESFASYGYRVYYTDKNRNAVLRLSGDGITNISDKGMSTFFKENLSNAGNIIGSYDEDKDTYNLTLNSKTVSFAERTDGWTSLKSFLPENGFSVSGDYYTVKDGELYQHNANLLRNFFYGVQYESSIKFIFNDEPALIKNFNTLNYEGTSSRVYSNDDDNVALIASGWYADSVETSDQSGQVIEFKEKEGKWFNNIIGVATTDANIDTKEFTMQGLGTIPASGVSVGDGTHVTRYTHTVFAYAPESPDPTVTLVGGIFGYPGTTNNIPNTYPTSESGNPGAIGETHVNSGFTVNATNKITGTAITSLRYLRNICNDLIFGETYTITADVTISSNNNNKTVGFVGAGLPASVRIDSTGVISHTWTVTKNTNISLFKGKNVACVIDNISVMVTPQEQPRSPKFRINTSPNDATVATFKTSVTNAADTLINNDAYNGGNDTVAFYVHPLVVNGAKWAVQASGITVSESSDPLNFLRNFNNNKTDGYINNGSWTASNSYQGTHSNVVKVEINIVGTMPAWNIDSILKFVVTPTLTQS